MLNVKLGIYLILTALCVAYAVKDANAQHSQNQPNDGREDYYNPVAGATCVVETTTKFEPLTHVKGYEGGGYTAYFPLVDLQTQDMQRATNPKELKQRKANQGIVVFAKDSNVLLALFNKYFALKVIDEKGTIQLFKKQNMSTAETNILIPPGIVVDTQMVSVVGLISGRYPNEEQKKDFVRVYETDIASKLFPEKVKRVKSLGQSKKAFEGELFSNEQVILESMLFAETDKESRKEVRKEVDSLERVNPKIRRKIEDANTLIAQYERELAEAIEPYVCVYKKNLYECFEYGGIILDGLKVVPEPLLAPEYATSGSKVVFRPFGVSVGETFEIDGITYEATANGKCVPISSVTGATTGTNPFATGVNASGFVQGYTTNLTTPSQYLNTKVYHSIDEQIATAYGRAGEQKAEAFNRSAYQQAVAAGSPRSSKMEIYNAKNNSAYDIWLSSKISGAAIWSSSH